ncbi:assembly of actin patch protein, partial [Tilletia horrida]
MYKRSSLLATRTHAQPRGAPPLPWSIGEPYRDPWLGDLWPVAMELGDGATVGEVSAALSKQTAARSAFSIIVDKHGSRGRRRRRRVLGLELHLCAQWGRQAEQRHSALASERNRKKSTRTSRRSSKTMALSPLLRPNDVARLSAGSSGSAGPAAHRRSNGRRRSSAGGSASSHRASFLLDPATAAALRYEDDDNFSLPRGLFDLSASASATSPSSPTPSSISLGSTLRLSARESRGPVQLQPAPRRERELESARAPMPPSAARLASKYTVPRSSTHGDLAAGHPSRRDDGEEGSALGMTGSTQGRRPVHLYPAPGHPSPPTCGGSLRTPPDPACRGSSSPSDESDAFAGHAVTKDLTFAKGETIRLLSTAPKRTNEQQDDDDDDDDDDWLVGESLDGKRRGTFPGGFVAYEGPVEDGPQDEPEAAAPESEQAQEQEPPTDAPASA